jgi:DNA-binding NtrC family response regulator
VSAAHTHTLPRASLAPRSPVISIPDSNKEAIQQALNATGGNREKTAELLRIGRTTLYRKMKEYGIACTEPSRPTAGRQLPLPLD